MERPVPRSELDDLSVVERAERRSTMTSVEARRLVMTG